eukprot:3472189-Prymnesium_polylepis.1
MLAALVDRAREGVRRVARESVAATGRGLPEFSIPVTRLAERGTRPRRGPNRWPSPSASSH